jgi:hypothetical protein
VDLSERGPSAARHPWELARAAFFVDVLRDHGLLLGAPRVLDVGAGDAFFASALRGACNRAEIALWDMHFSDADLASLADAGFTASTSKPSGPFDVAVLLDVAEHVDDDRAFLAEVLASCTPSAHVLFSVPAWPQLWSKHDEALSHRRRYRPREARALLANAGLDVVEGGGVFHGLIAPRVLGFARERVGLAPEQNGVGAWRGGLLVTNAIVAALRLEQRFSRALSSRGVDAPGLSWWALARRST